MRPFVLKVLSRGDVLFQGEIDSVSSVNDTGKFDILPGHAHFISLIRNYLIIREKGGRTRELKIGSGILKVINNQASIYLGINR